MSIKGVYIIGNVYDRAVYYRGVFNRGTYIKGFVSYRGFLLYEISILGVFII